MNEIGHCEHCKQKIALMNIFLCKGRMLCTGCWMTETKANTIFFNEDDYPRKRDSQRNPMRSVEDG
jgi:hypothetical protein